MREPQDSSNDRIPDEPGDAPTASPAGRPAWSTLSSEGPLFDITIQSECPNCSQEIGLLLDQAQIDRELLGGQGTACPRCQRPLSWWDVVLRAIRLDVPNSPAIRRANALRVAGARTTLLFASAYPNRGGRMHLGEHGIPSDADILAIEYQPHPNAGEDPVTPVTLAVLPPDPADPGSGARVLHFNVSLRPDPPEPQHMWVYVTWVPSGAPDANKRSLLEALDHFRVGRLTSAVLAANVAVELTVGGLLRRVFEATSGAETVEGFLTNGATYGHQLRVLLPALVRLAGAPPLRPQIYGHLHRLNSLRNEVAHTGGFRKLKPPQDRLDVSSCVCSALFAVRYFELVGTYLTKSAAVPPQSSHGTTGEPSAPSDAAPSE